MKDNNNHDSWMWNEVNMTNDPQTETQSFIGSIVEVTERQKKLNLRRNNQMKDNVQSSIHIDYHWKTDSGINIPEAHKQALKEDAEERIFQMIKEGYNQGELCTTVRFGKDLVPEEDEEDGLEYSGWWGVETKPND